MQQVARNLTDVSDGFLLNSRYLIMDRDTKYTEEFRDYLDREGVKPVRCSVRAAQAIRPARGQSGRHLRDVALRRTGQSAAGLRPGRCIRSLLRRARRGADEELVSKTAAGRPERPPSPP